MIKRFWKNRKTYLANVDNQGNDALSLLRSRNQQGPLSDTITFVPGVELHADPALGITGNYHSPTGQILEVESKMANAGEWVGLHVALPALDVSNNGMLGFAARLSASEVFMIQACLRSGLDEGGFKDHFFEKHLLLRPEAASHLDALSVHQTYDFPIKAPWRELILFLPTKDFKLSLIDLRVFVV